MKLETAQLASPRILDGDKLYLKRAKITLPYLVRQAKAKKTIYYSDLAQEIGVPNPRNLNYILGAIGNALTELGRKNAIEIPAIQCVVINKQTELPGEGIGWFINKKDFKKLSKSDQKDVVNIQLAKIFAFQRWDWVLEQLGLKPLKTNIEAEIEKAKAYKPGAGESALHKRFKEYIANHPESLGLNKDLMVGVIEYQLPSNDKIDVVFTDQNLKIGIEVKSRISDNIDILRGLFQCVKYKSLVEAEQAIENLRPNGRIILALESGFPAELIGVKNILGIEVVDNIKIEK